MKRTLVLIFTLLLIAAGSAATVTAKDHKPDKNDKAEAKITAEACKKNGWRTLTTEDRDDDDDPKAFKNQGQCQKYVKDGGQLVRIEPEGDLDAKSEDEDDNDGLVLASSTAVPTAAVTPDKDQATETSLVMVGGTKPWDGYLQGTGFTAGEELTSVTFASDRETLTLTSPVGTVIDANGTFVTQTIIYWCSEYHGYDETSGTVTVQDSAGKTYSQTFEMATYCGVAE